MMQTQAKQPPQQMPHQFQTTFAEPQPEKQDSLGQLFTSMSQKQPQPKPQPNFNPFESKPNGSQPYNPFD